jgi:uncharacterized protein YjbJ (UPF0337 family)
MNVLATVSRKLNKKAGGKEVKATGQIQEKGGDAHDENFTPF